MSSHSEERSLSLMRVAFLGLGHMGLPMAANLAGAGYDVVGFDVFDRAVRAAREAGLGVADSAIAATSGADVVITMFQSGAQVIEAYRGSAGAAGLLAVARPGTLFIDSSTIAVEAEAPAKIVAQEQTAEAFVLGERLGLDHQALFDVASHASGQCWALTTNCPVPGPVPTSPANRDYRPGFAGALMNKDLGLAEQAMDLTGVDARMGRLAREIYQEFAAGAGAGQDFSGIIRTIRDTSGH